KVIAGDRGGALLRKPLILGHVIEKVLKYTDLPVSIKIRGGFTPADDLNELLKIIFNYDIAWVTLNRAPIRLNGRLKSEIYGSIKYFKQYHDYEIKYIDKSNKQLNSKKTIPLIVNGNIQIKTIDSLGLQDLEGIMIGREALENPFMYIRMFKHIMRKNENKKLKIGVGTLPENFNANILFKELIRILNKYKEQNRTTWLKLSKFKLILFHFIKYKYLKSDKRKEQKYKQMPQGLGWARWEKNKFSMDELLNVLKGAFPELQEEIFTQLKKIIIN
ncbi:MAG: tRNA-dihydrouridine synthase, partial [Promethearchaeota archaeon]